MKKRLVFRTLALAVTGIFLLAGTAFAVDWTVSTQISVKVSPGTRIGAGDKVTFSGHLESEKKLCRVGRTVSLVEVGQGAVDKTKTGDKGAFEFSPQRISATSDWKVKFKGYTKGTHQKIHTCLASTSRKVTITVTG